MTPDLRTLSVLFVSIVYHAHEDGHDDAGDDPGRVENRVGLGPRAASAAGCGHAGKNILRSYGLQGLNTYLPSSSPPSTPEDPS